MIAALFVETGGCYYGLEGVDPWDITRDARLYAGPFPVVAHPPCNRWSVLSYINQARYAIGDDGGCFAAALAAVRQWGGVLEHPAYSIAWSRFNLPTPRRCGWVQTLDDPGWTTEVSQSAYGHRARKPTWLYYVGPNPPRMDWGDPPADCKVSDLHQNSVHRDGRKDRPRMYQKEALATPPAFRDALIALARSACGTVPTT